MRGDQLEVLRNMLHSSHGFVGLMKECGTNIPSTPHLSSQMKFPSISHTPSLLQHAPSSQHSPLQQNCVPTRPQSSSSGRAVQAIVLKNGLHVSQVFAWLT